MAWVGVGSALRELPERGALPRWMPLVDMAWAILLAAVLLPTTLRTIVGSSWPAGLQAAALTAVLCGHGAVALRRAAPRLAFGVVGAVVLLLVLAPVLQPGGDQVRPFSAILVPSVLVFPVVLYSVAAWCPHRTSLLALAAALAGAVVVLVRLWGADYLTVAQAGLATTDHPVRSWPLFLVIGVMSMAPVPWWAGRYRRLRMLYVAELEQRARHEEAERTAQARRAVTEERRRIAREMHDVVAHSLSVLVTQAEGGRLMASKDPAVAPRALETIARTGREAMRSMAGVLRILDDPTHVREAVAPPQPGLAELPRLVDEVRLTGLRVQWEEHGHRRRLADAAELAAYRMVQEALTNVLKHAGPDASTEVRLTWRHGSLSVRVTNGKTQRPSAAGSGLGLTTMADRLTAVGGSLRVTDDLDRFRVEASLPTAEDDVS